MRRLAAACALAAAAGCLSGGRRGELEVDWTVAGSAAEGMCGVYGAAYAHVLIDGPEFASDRIDCEYLGVRYVDLRPGTYFVHVELLDAYEASLVPPFEFYTEVVSDQRTVEEIDFPAGDFPPEWLLGDLRVEWSIDGAQSPSLCAERNAVALAVELDGPSARSEEIACDDFEVIFADLDVGMYAVSATLLDEGGAPRTTTAEFETTVYAATETIESVDFPDDSFLSQTASLTVSWTINEGVDDCEDAGVATARVVVGGADPADAACADGSVTVDGLPAGEADVSVVLLDAGGDEATTAVVTTIELAGATTLDASFPASAFLEQRAGWLRFALDWEGGACEEASPPVEDLVLSLGVVPSPMVCGDTTCVSADGVTPLPCASETLVTDPLPWGPAMLHVGGREAGGQFCWETTFDVVVGAGENDLVPLDVPRTSSLGTCAP